jgi:hypothetical protein
MDPLPLESCRSSITVSDPAHDLRRSDRAASQSSVKEALVVSRPNITDEVIYGLSFAQACVLDQRAASHDRKDHSWDDRYDAALAAIDFIVSAHKRTVIGKMLKERSKTTARTRRKVT